MSSIQRLTAWPIASAVLVQLLWGHQFVAIKQGLASFPPMFFASMRFAAIALLLIPFVASPDLRRAGRIFVISLFVNGLSLSLTYLSLALGSGTLTAITLQLNTPFVILLAWPLLGDKPALPTLCGVLVAFLGVALAASGRGPSISILPVLLGTLAALGFGSVLVKKFGPFEPLMLMGWMSLFTVPQVLLLSLVFEHGQIGSLAVASSGAWWSLFYTVVFGGIVGFGIWFWLLGKYSMGHVAPFGLLIPVFTALSSILLLNERLTTTLLVGGLMALAGIAITQVNWRSAAPVANLPP